MPLFSAFITRQLSKNFLHVCLNGKWSQEVNLGFSSPTLISDAKTFVFVSQLLKLPIEYI